MAKRRIQPSDEEIGRRARQMARQLSDQVFVSPEGAYVVTGRPEFRKLYHCLQSVRSVPELVSNPTPIELGFAPGQITPLNRENLSVRARALQKWRKILEDYEKPKQKKAERRRKYKEWKTEINRLSICIYRGRCWMDEPATTGSYRLPT
jgi:hypothetical protein